MLDREGAKVTTTKGDEGGTIVLFKYLHKYLFIYCKYFWYCVFESVQSHPFWIPNRFGTSIQSILKDTKNRTISHSWDQELIQFSKIDFLINIGQFLDISYVGS